MIRGVVLVGFTIMYVVIAVIFVKREFANDAVFYSKLATKKDLENALDSLSARLETVCVGVDQRQCRCFLTYHSTALSRA